MVPNNCRMTIRKMIFFSTCAMTPRRPARLVFRMSHFMLPFASNICHSSPTHMAITRELTIQNKLGIHARPAAQFVKIANRFTCEVRVEKDGEEVEGKSIMGLMMLAAGHGSVITVTTDGSDEEAAMDALSDLIARKFEED